jgi:hypothetical protein
MWKPVTSLSLALALTAAIITAPKSAFAQEGGLLRAPSVLNPVGITTKDGITKFIFEPENPDLTTSDNSQPEDVIGQNLTYLGIIQRGGGKTNSGGKDYDTIRIDALFIDEACHKYFFQRDALKQHAALEFGHHRYDAKAAILEFSETIDRAGDDPDAVDAIVKTVEKLMPSRCVAKDGLHQQLQGQTYPLPR